MNNRAQGTEGWVDCRGLVTALIRGRIDCRQRFGPCDAGPYQATMRRQIVAKLEELEDGSQVYR